VGSSERLRVARVRSCVSGCVWSGWVRILGRVMRSAKCSTVREVKDMMRSI
jgi:hypothetical protein